MTLCVLPDLEDTDIAWKPEQGSKLTLTNEQTLEETTCEHSDSRSNTIL